MQWPFSMECLIWVVQHCLRPVSIFALSVKIFKIRMSLRYYLLNSAFIFDIVLYLWIPSFFFSHGGESWVAWCLKAGVSNLLKILKAIVLASLSQTSGAGPLSILFIRSNSLLSDFALQWRHVPADLMADLNLQLNCWWIKSLLSVPDLLSPCKFCPS